MELKISDWVTIGAAVVTAIPVIWAAFQYILIKRAEEKDRNFRTYHRLIKELVQGDGVKSEDPVYLDRQVAVIYELRNFPTYYPVTLRILDKSMISWGLTKQRYLLAESAHTVSFIKGKQALRSYLCLERDE